MATPLHMRLKQGLNEARILVLGAQILLGFQFRAFLHPGFEHLPIGAQYAKAVGLGLLLVALALAVSPAPFHQLAEHGQDTRRINWTVSAVMNVVLVPFALALGIDIFAAVARLTAMPVALVTGVAAALVALGAWYGLAFMARWRRGGAGVSDSEREKGWRPGSCGKEVAHSSGW